jgi:hypothetical protein
VVADQLEQQLQEWERRQPGISKSAQAGLALALAAKIDDPSTNATALSNCANSLDRVLERMESNLPPLVEGDVIDEIRAKRQQRRAG